jgi:hypothetical protein
MLNSKGHLSASISVINFLQFTLVFSWYVEIIKVLKETFSFFEKRLNEMLANLYLSILGWLYDTNFFTFFFFHNLKIRHLKMIY